MDKWTLLDDLGAAREALGLSDRTLGVLRALVSFQPGRVLEQGAPLVVFPSNRTLAGRLNGMAESTLRRHLAALVEAGLIDRRDSPNGKRYARRAPGGGLRAAFGFDLTPLVARAGEIARRAAAAREAIRRCGALREAIGIVLRDLVRACGAGIAETVAEVRRLLRRKLGPEALAACLARLESLAGGLLPTTDPGGDDNRIGRHEESGQTEDISAGGTGLAQVLAVCPDLSLFAGKRIATWPDLIATAESLAPMLGVERWRWLREAQAVGPIAAAVAVGYVLQRQGGIAETGAYFHRLCAEMAAGRTDAERLLRSLARRRVDSCQPAPCPAPAPAALPWAARGISSAP